jgi:acyl dehydratase
VAAFDELEVGQRFMAPRRTVTESLATTMTALAGYTHPLFTDAVYVREHTPFERPPIAGGLVLLLCGGLAEQTDVFDEHTVALLGFDDVGFPAPSFHGDTLALEMEVTELNPSSRGDRGVAAFRWTCTRDDGEVVAVATARLLLRHRQDGSRPSR